MKIKWIKKENNTNLILFFTGWGMDENPTKHIKFENSDFCICYDYQSFEKGIIKEWKNYKNIKLFAWSMGVWAASYFLQSEDLNFTKKIAINGTITPIHNSEGIPELIYDGTLNNFSEKNREKFFLRMCGRKANYTFFNRIKPQRTSENQREELAFLAEKARQENISDFSWDLAIISNNDKIFPAEAQKKSWKQQNVRITETDFPHYPFALIESWEEIEKL